MKSLQFDTFSTLFSTLDNRNTVFNPPNNDNDAESQPQSKILIDILCDSDRIKLSGDMRAVMSINAQEKALDNNITAMHMLVIFMIKEKFQIKI